MLEQLAAAVQQGGGLPVRALGLQALPGPQVPHRLVIYAWEGDPERLRLLSQKLRPAAQLVALCPARTLAQKLQLLHDAHCNHVLTADDEGLALLRVTVQKFVSGDLFGIDKYLPPGTQVHLLRLRDYQGRQNAIDQVMELADRAGVRRQVRAAVAVVCEELLMNALYDAPVTPEGAPLFAEVDVKERLHRLSPRPVSIRYAAAGGRFAVAVRDRFGRLDKETVLRYIAKCLQSGDQIDRKTYGAGLGLYLIANSAHQYVVNIAPGMATEVICTFQSGARQPLRALSLFVYPGSPASKT